MNPTQTLSGAAQPCLQPEVTPAPAPSRKGAGGPRTAEGKSRSSLNNLRHGLAGSFRIIDQESQEMFHSLRDALREEHQPATATEELLVQRIAEHYWLSRRAQQLQDTAMLLNATANLSLAMRYQAMHDRGFHKCLTELRKAKKERLQQEPQPQNQEANQPSNEFESQSCSTPESQPAEFESQNFPSPKRRTLSEFIAHLRATGQPLSAIARAKAGAASPLPDTAKRGKLG